MDRARYKHQWVDLGEGNWNLLLSDLNDGWVIDWSGVVDKVIYFILVKEE